MPRAKNKKAEEARLLLAKGKKITEIAELLGVSVRTVTRWKTDTKQDTKSDIKHDIKQKMDVSKRGAGPGNKNARKHGLFQRYLPSETLEIVEELKEKSLLDILWDSILLQYASILRAQRIMHVEGIEDGTKEVISTTEGASSGTGYEVQFAWDKQANFIKAQSRAVDSLRVAIKEYLELEGRSKEESKEMAKDWKQAIIEIQKRREHG